MLRIPLTPSDSRLKRSAYESACQTVRSELAIDSGGQPRQVGLHDVVVGAGPHRGDRGVFADGFGKKNEGQVRMLLPDDRQGLDAAEAGHRVVGDHQVPLRLVQLPPQRLGGVDPARKHVVTGAAQREFNHRRVVRGVFDLQQP